MKNLKIIRKFCFIAILSAVTMSAVAQGYHFKSIDKRFDDTARQLARLDFENKREQITDEQLRTLNKIADSLNDKQLKARAIYWNVRSRYIDASPTECIKILEKARAMASAEHDYDLACIKYQLAGNYERTSNYLKAYNLLNETLPVFEKYGDNFYHGNASLLMAQLFIDINDPESSKKYLEIAEKEYAKAKFPLNRIYFFKALLAGTPDKTRYLKMSVRDGGDQDWGMTLQAYTSITDIFINQDKLDSAMVYSRKSYELLKNKAPDNSFFWTLYNISHVKVLYAMGKYKDVERIMLKEEGKASKNNEKKLLIDVYDYLWKTYEKLGDKDKAYHYLKLYAGTFFQDNVESRQHDIQKAQAREAIARHNDTIKILEQDAELNKRYMVLVVLFTVVVLLVGLVLFLYFYQRYKIKKVENRELRNNLRQESLIHNMNLRNFKRDIKQKECEISSSTLLLANKNEVLQQISLITKKFSDNGKIPKEYVEQVNAVIGDSLRNDDEWQRFKLHFDSVHPEFFIKLKAKCSELTENDLRLCAYIRIGMRAKQIAEMLSVSPDSVNSNRYRLRKKLEISKGESLDDFIRNI